MILTLCILWSMVSDLHLLDGFKITYGGGNHMIILLIIWV